MKVLKAPSCHSFFDQLNMIAETSLLIEVCVIKNRLCLCIDLYISLESPVTSSFIIKSSCSIKSNNNKITLLGVNFVKKESLLNRILASLMHFFSLFLTFILLILVYLGAKGRKGHLDLIVEKLPSSEPFSFPNPFTEEEEEFLKEAMEIYLRNNSGFKERK